MSKKADIELSRALSVDNVLSYKFTGLPFEGEMRDVFGTPERAGSWIIWGHSGSGKTTFNMQLARYISQFEKVIYNSLEEWPSASIASAYKRAGLKQGDKLIMVGEPMDLFAIRMQRKRSPNVMIIDSVKYTKFRWSDYEKFCKLFPNKLKIWVAHAKGKEPKGGLAVDIQFDSHVKIYTEGYRAFITSRFSDNGSGHLDIWPAGARKYWGELEETDL
ncbi:MAG: ATP-binding protein [Bacteroidales bacterium]|nr:ATP-binding protein [Bacteroidales bacterium]HOI31195.1 ATP-binding protein [Bacteroidales bacterium]